MKLKKQLEQLLARVAAMQIPIYAGNASFFLLLSVFPIVSLLLSLLPYTPLTLAHLLGFCAQLAPEWLDVNFLQAVLVTHDHADHIKAAGRSTAQARRRSSRPAPC